MSEFFRDLGRRSMPSSYLDRARPLLVDVARAVGFAPCWERDAVEVDRADGTGRVPWTVPLTSAQATDLPFAVFNACLFVVAALSGMRAGELMELTTQSCPPPREHGEALFRYSLASRRIKGAKLGGVADEWVVIEPAYRAVELATRLSHSEKGVSHFLPESSIFGRFEFLTRFNTFRRWVNAPRTAGPR